MSSAFSSIKSISIRHKNIDLSTPSQSSTSKPSTNQPHKSSRTPRSQLNNQSINHHLSYCTNFNDKNDSKRSKCQSNYNSHRNSHSKSVSRVPKSSIKTEKYMRQLIERVFRQCQEQYNIGQVLTSNNLIQIFISLGFFNDPLTKQNNQSFKFIKGILDRDNKGINKRNIIKLIFIIMNIDTSSNNQQQRDICNGLKRDTYSDSIETCYNPQEIIGVIDCNDNWIITPKEELQIKQKLGYLYYNRVSNEHVKYKKPVYQQYYQQPKLSDNSSRLSSRHRKHLQSIDIDNSSNVDVSRLYERQSIYKKKHNEWYQKQLKAAKNKQIQQCSFKPRINGSNTSRSKISNYSSVNKSNIDLNKSTNQLKHNKQNKLEVKREVSHLTSTQRENIQKYKQCTFKPKLNTSRFQEFNLLQVKNSSKSITRIQQAYQQKLKVLKQQQRGYPKSSYQYQKPSQKGNKYNKNNPALEIDIKIGTNQSSLKIYEGQLFQNLVCKVLVMNKLPYEHMNRISGMIEGIINQSQTAMIRNGFVVCK